MVLYRQFLAIIRYVAQYASKRKFVVQMCLRSCHIRMHTYCILYKKIRVSYICTSRGFEKHEGFGLFRKK